MRTADVVIVVAVLVLAVVNAAFVIIYVVSGSRRTARVQLHPVLEAVVDDVRFGIRESTYAHEPVAKAEVIFNFGHLIQKHRDRADTVQA